MGNATTFGREAGLNPSEVRSFLVTAEGRYWAGATAGLFELQALPPSGGVRFRAVPRDDGRPTGAIWALAESRDGSIWCGSERGLLQLTPSRDGFRLREVEIGLPRTSDDVQIVRSVLEDDRGTLWVGTASGLYVRGSGGRIRRITTDDGLPVNEVRALARDGTGRLWVATRQGLAWVERDAQDAGGQPLVRRVFTAVDGLPASNVNALFADFSW